MVRGNSVRCRLPVQVAAIVIGVRCVHSVRDELPACAFVGALVDGQACHAILFERDEDAAVVSSVRLVLELDERDVGLPVGQLLAYGDRRTVRKLRQDLRCLEGSSE